ncbi:MAG: hypothetical protein ACK4S2_07065 [Gemmobacter sp.]|uniref:hypothetical protein n=1 Tax=Gemmobacter sp. TaxID=1898957 RepID=UPI00391BE746
MSGARQPWTDAEMLRALALRDAGMSAARIAARIGRTRKAVLRLFERIEAELAQSEAVAVLALCLALGAAPALALADTARIMGSSVTLRATDRPGALAEVEFVNDPSNGSGDDGLYLLAHGGLEIDARFRWNADGDDDRIEVLPPPGITCDPDCTLTVPEGSSGMLWLIDLNRVGM